MIDKKEGKQPIIKAENRRVNNKGRAGKGKSRITESFPARNSIPKRQPSKKPSNNK